MQGVQGLTGLKETSAVRATLRPLGALLVYVAFFAAALGSKLLPAHPGRILSSGIADPSIMIWSLGWWAHAIPHGQLVPYTHVVFAPTGTNLAWTTSIPTIGILLAPITRALGPIAAYNVVAVLALATAGWATCILVHHVTGRWAPSMLAGLLFAISPLQLEQVRLGHLNLAFTALVPLGVYLVVRLMEGSLRTRTFVPLFAVVAAAQLGISTEIFVTATAFGILLLALLFGFDPQNRTSIRRAGRALSLGYVGALLLAGPLLYAAFALPRPSGLVSGHRAPFSGVETHLRLEAGPAAVALCVGVPLVVVLVNLVRQRGRPPIVRAAALTALVALVCSVGVLVVGRTTIPTPWTALRRLPLAGLIRPQRLTMLAWLIAAVGIGAWIADRPWSRARWVAAAVVASAMLPALWLGSWTSVVPPSPVAPGPRQVLAAGENVAVVAGSEPRSRQFGQLALPTVWQVQGDFAFRLANAYVGSFSPSLPAGVRRWMFDRPLAAGQAGEVLAWLRANDVGAVLIVAPTRASVGRAHALLGTAPRRVGDVVLMPVARGAS